jgi:DNA-binding protein YbaB
MEDLIKALQILLKYGNPKWPTHCEHDIMIINIDPAIVSDEDIKKLEALDVSAEYSSTYGDPCFYSYRYGSC